LHRIYALTIPHDYSYSGIASKVEEAVVFWLWGSDTFHPMAEGVRGNLLRGWSNVVADLVYRIAQNDKRKGKKVLPQLRQIRKDVTEALESKFSLSSMYLIF
jgi:hypothetical protein